MRTRHPQPPRGPSPQPGRPDARKPSRFTKGKRHATKRAIVCGRCPSMGAGRGVIQPARRSDPASHSPPARQQSRRAPASSGHNSRAATKHSVWSAGSPHGTTPGHPGDTTPLLATSAWPALTARSPAPPVSSSVAPRPAAMPVAPPPHHTGFSGQILLPSLAAGTPLATLQAGYPPLPDARRHKRRAPDLSTFLPEKSHET